MTESKSDILDVDTETLFKEHNIDKIIEIKNTLDAEIERKRKDLRSMIGDRYKDILVASDAITCMKDISQNIVDSLTRITGTCENLLSSINNIDTGPNYAVNSKVLEEQAIVSQIKLAIFMNEQIWIALDEENNLKAAQYYLLAQHIHTGLSLSKKVFIDRVPLLVQVKTNLSVLRSKILQKIIEKLEYVETSAQETSQNLNAFLLLENQGCNDLIRIFIEHRRTALNTVINSQYSSVRAQICSMVKCLITTVHLLHDCFLSVKNGCKGLIWQQLQDIMSPSAPPTLSKLDLPIIHQDDYIPDVISKFRPTGKFLNQEQDYVQNTEVIIKNWMDSTRTIVRDGLKKAIELVPNMKGLHLVREESLKIQPPDNWDQICKDSHLPENFDVWYFFFQDVITERCRSLICRKVSSNLSVIQDHVRQILDSASSSEKSETDLTWYIWAEDMDDVSKNERTHLGLSMKARGYSQNIASLCSRLDKTYLELLEDASQYLYAKEYNDNINFTVVVKDFKFKRKFVDKNEIENHLQAECIKTCLELSNYCNNLLTIETSNFITKSTILARFMQAVTLLCPHLHRCCIFNISNDDWIKVCDAFNTTSQNLWTNWTNSVLETTEKHCEELNNICPERMLKILSRWDEIEIQEQTDEKVFVSHIQVPLKPSLILNEIFNQLNNTIGLKIPHTVPKSIHAQFIEKNIMIILKQYKRISEEEKLNQKQALQFLFDVKFLTTLCIPGENVQLLSYSQEICDTLKSRIDPFDLDVFYSYLQNNVKKAVIQSQLIAGCLLSSSNQLANLGVSDKLKQGIQNPNLLALSAPSMSTWFPLLPVSVPSQKLPGTTTKNDEETTRKSSKAPSNKFQDPASFMRQSTASLFGGLTSDWF
ncbi:unnamed protein product [Diabrotica balteata]|uniref:Conserved oligomeric Golgi complex subunit 1 n=1 Tax=Diabrotica balteata TaxID=107213 RepID=A0A9N9XHY5_DIABA|nr:unnamed protein product [Diabrotica balteata]